MAWTDEGSLGTNNSKTSSNNITITTTEDAFDGEVVIVMTAWDNNNNTTIVGPIGNNWTITDSVGGNTWAFIAGGEDAGTNARAAAGIYYTILSSDMPTGSVITITYNSSRTAKAATARHFSMSNGTTLRIATIGCGHSRATDPFDCFIRFDGLSAEEVLILHCLAGEGPETDAYTMDSDYTAFASDGTTGSTADTNMHVRGLFRIVSSIAEDTISVTSTTADRDYTQLTAVLYEVPSGETPVDPLGPIYDNTGFLFHSAPSSAWSTRTQGHGQGVAQSGNVIYLVSPGIPAGAFCVVCWSWDNNNTVTQTGPNDTTPVIDDSASNTWTHIAGAQNALAAESGQWSAIIGSILANEIPKGGYVRVRSDAATQGAIWARSAQLLVFHIEGTTFTVADRAMDKFDGQNPPSLTLSSLTSRKYLMMHVTSWEGPRGDESSVTADSDYTMISPWRGSTGGTDDQNMSVVTEYRIAQLTGDTVNLDRTTGTDRGMTQLLAAIYTDTVASPFVPKTRYYRA